MKKCWHKYPIEKPEKSGYYLVRGKGGLEDKIYHYVCLWIVKSNIVDIPSGFYHNGNEFKTLDGECEWMSLEDLPKY